MRERTLIWLLIGTALLGCVFMSIKDVELVDYGFFWGHIYDAAGFDDITWWLFEKK